MQNLFLIDGASGVGKSDLLRWAMENNAHGVTFLPKATTRIERDYEKNDPEILLDLEFMDDVVFSARDFEYIYHYGGAKYGISSTALMEAVKKYDNVISIVRNTTLIQRIAADFSFMNVVPMFIYTDRAELTERLKSNGHTEEQIQFRVARSEIALRDYYTHPEFYREIIINNSSRDVFHSTIERVMGKHLNAARIDPYNVSVMMSYNPKNKKLDDYFDAMEAAVTSISPSFCCHRVDKIPGSPKISAEFRSLAAGAQCVIIDLTENKQNVYYELGYLHALGKTCIITAEEGTTPTFYPAEYRILFYQSARELREKIKDELVRVLSIGTMRRESAAVK